MKSNEIWTIFRNLGFLYYYLQSASSKNWSIASFGIDVEGVKLIWFMQWVWDLGVPLVIQFPTLLNLRALSPSWPAQEHSRVIFGIVVTITGALRTAMPHEWDLLGHHYTMPIIHFILKFVYRWIIRSLNLSYVSMHYRILKRTQCCDASWRGSWKASCEVSRVL